MATLPSGLEEIIADDEDLARYLTSSSQFNAVMVKPAAFLPNPKDRETSVFRHGSEPRDRLWAIGVEYAAGGRNLHGAAICKARHVRAAQLEVTAEEPPPRHAAIRGWPFSEADPELQKAKQKELAALPSREQKRINERLRRLADTPRPSGITVLQGQKDTYYRLRVGDYRILYQIQDKALLVLVVKVGHRHEVYR